jgi:hypothetical protein
VFPKESRTRARLHLVISPAGKRFSSHSSSVSSVFPSGIALSYPTWPSCEGWCVLHGREGESCWQSQGSSSARTSDRCLSNEQFTGFVNVPVPGPRVPRYCLAEVRPHMPLQHWSEDSNRTSMETSSARGVSEIHLAKTYNIPKIPISILQTLWEIVTLYPLVR